jgi:hypothetical protein
MMKNKKILSIVQNFVCTSDHRMKMVFKNLPKMSKIFDKVNFYVVYNTKKNLKEIEEEYKKHIKNLYFEYSDSKDWGLKTLELVNRVETPYVMYLCEDFDFLCGEKDWNDALDEMLVKNKVDFVMLAKIEKYSNPQSEWISYYDKVEDHAMYYNGLGSPSKVMSIDAIYKKDFLVERLKEYTKKYSHHLPNNYETFYKNKNGIRRFDMNCAIPRKLLLYSYHPEGAREASLKDMDPINPIGLKGK